MIALLSPAKSLDYTSPLQTSKSTQPRFKEETTELVTHLKKMSAAQLGKLMSISEKLSDLNHDRYQTFESDYTKENARQAILAFTGDVYQGLTLAEWSPEDFANAQKSLRILSGLYGILRPLDLMQPYRLEMGTHLATQHGKTLYDFWGSKITAQLNKDLGKGETFINLASNEYFSSVKAQDLKGQLITPVFKDEKNGTYKIISFYAKKARGMMADFIVRNQLTDPNDLKKFNTAGYKLNAKESTDDTFVFFRAEQ